MRLRSEADLDTLDRLHGHDRLGQLAVEFAIPLRVCAEPKRQAFDADFDDAAESVPSLPVRSMYSLSSGSLLGSSV